MSESHFGGTKEAMYMVARKTLPRLKHSRRRSAHSHLSQNKLLRPDVRVQVCGTGLSRHLMERRRCELQTSNYTHS